MPKYKVMVYGGMDGLMFDDLIVTYSSGYKYHLRVKQGNYVPVEIFDPLDIQKSLVVGSLGSYIRVGAVKVEHSDLEKNNKKRKPQPVQEEQKQEPQQAQPVVEVETIPQPKAEEAPKVQEAPTNLKDVKEANDFFKLSFFNRLKFIQNCTDKGVLSDLLSKIDSPQLKNNIVYRLEQL